jgi:hypothetical protein
MQHLIDTFNFVDTECGSGKTTAFCQQIINNSHKKHLIIQSTIALMNQTYNILLPAFSEDGIIVISSEIGLEPAFKQLQESVLDDTKRVIICTDKTGFRLKSYENLFVHVDDVSSVSNYVDYIAHEGVIKSAMDYFSVSSYNNNSIDLKLKPKQHRIDKFYSAIHKEFNGLLQYDHNVVLKQDYEKILNIQVPELKMNSTTYKLAKLSVVQFYDLCKLQSASEVTFYNARFNDIILYHCFKNKIKFKLVQLPGIKDRTMKFNSRIECYYFKDMSCSSQWMKDHPSEMSDILKLIDKETNFIYAVNNEIPEECYIPLNGERIPVRSQGMNQHRGATTCGWIVSEKPATKESMIYKAIFGDHFTSELLLRAREFYDLYQFVCRSNLRDMDSTTVVKVFVFDKAQAMYLMEGGPITKLDGSWDLGTFGRPPIERDIDDKMYVNYKMFVSRQKKLNKSGLDLLSAIKGWIVKKNYTDIYNASEWLQEDIQKRCNI